MGKEKLIIVESPAKAKTIEKILGKDFKVLASYGHIRDLPEKELGVDIENGFKPKYVLLPSRKKIIDTIKDLSKKVEKLYLATDPDREGEAIAWHLVETLKLPKDKFTRIEFHEITPRAIQEAIRNPRDIDLDKVEAQQARRILDRLVGYELSPLLWEKVRRGLSAGRVQSVALKLICEKEEEIEKFVPEEYWHIYGEFKDKDKIIYGKLVFYKEEEITIRNEKEAKRLIEVLNNLEYKIDRVVIKEEKKTPPLPFITSTLQQEASRRLGFPVSKTMKIAQSLYEGVDIGDERVGLITYMRTDSTRIAPEAREEAVTYIDSVFGKEYVGKERKERKKLGMQDAHEAIRPTSVLRTPEKVKKYLTEDQYKLYKLIWERFLASQMANALYDVIEIDIKGGDYTFVSKGRKLKFAGFMSLYTEKEEEEEEEVNVDYIPQEGSDIDLINLTPKRFFTQPPPRYTEATLVRTLEKYGIGRPSTYATIIETLKERKYVEVSKKELVPTTLGKVVNEFLTKQFPHLIDVKFTAKMEEDLDKIESGEVKAIEVLEKFYPSFKEELERVSKNFGKIQVVEKTDEFCPICGRELVIRENKHGKYYACSAYPECKYTKPIYEEAHGKCPLCGGIVVKKKARKTGKVFWGCINYPNCSFASPYEPLDEKCPQCGSVLLKGNGFKKCSNENCNYIVWIGRRKRWKKSK
ncbi:MAG: type I DNA topoisomerase [Dictyoglomus thermophilum]